MVGTWPPQYGAAVGVGGFRDLGLGSTWTLKNPPFRVPQGFFAYDRRDFTTALDLCGTRVPGLGFRVWGLGFGV